MSDEIKDVQNAQEESQQIDEQTRDEKEGILKDLDGKTFLLQHVDQRVGYPLLIFH